MKKIDFLFVIALLSTLVSLLFVRNASAQDTVPVPTPFEVAILKVDGTPLSQQERAEEKTTTGPGQGEVSTQFKYNGQTVQYGYKTTGEKGGKFSFESPLFKDGSVGIGFRFPMDRNLPAVSVSGKSATFKDSNKTTVSWTAETSFVQPKSRKKLNIILAEYGANDKWMDVTTKVKKFQIGDSLEFRPSNALFGKDPASGVPKSILITYILEDENDETEDIKEFRENSVVRIQFDPKDQYFRFVGKGAETFEFNVQTNSNGVGPRFNSKL